MSRIVSTSENEFQDLRESRNPQDTRNSTQYAVNLYQKWREEHTEIRNRYAPFDWYFSLLNHLIAVFIVEIRKKDIKPYHQDPYKSRRTRCINEQKYRHSPYKVTSLVKLNEKLTID